MPKSRFVQNSFVSGEVSPIVKARTDIDQYYRAVETGENVLIVPQGGLKKRPGTKHIQNALNKLVLETYTGSMPEGGTFASISDDDDTTTTTTTTNIGTVNPYVAAKADLGASTYVEFVDLRGILLTSGTSTEFVVQSSDDDITYTTVKAIPSITTTSQNMRIAVQTTARYWQIARVGATDLGTAKLTLATLNLYSLGTVSYVKTMDMSVESNRHYLFVVTEGNIRVFKAPDTHVADIKVPYLSDDIRMLRDAQSENVSLIFHEDYAPIRIINQGNDADWFQDEIPFTNVPQFDYNDTSSPTPTSDVQTMVLTGFVAGDTFQIDIEGVLSKNITFAGDASADEQASTVFNIEKNIQDMPVMADEGVTVARTGALTYTITSADGSAKAFELFSGFATSGTGTKTVAFTHTTTGSPRKEDVWSSTRGYPKCACFFEGRLFLGGTRSKKQSLFASRSGSFFDFFIEEGDDDEGIFATISSRRLGNIVDVAPGRNLQIFTNGGEFAVLARPITPTTIDLTPQTSHGSFTVIESDIEISNLESKEVDGASLFIDRNGRTLRDFIYSFNEDAYIANDKSVLSSHIISNPVDFAILSGTDSDDANWVAIVNDDGSMAMLNTLRSQDINGFTRWTVDGNIKGVSVVDKYLYITVLRDSVYRIERWDDTLLLDGAISASATATVSGLDHLEGKTVGVVKGYTVYPDRVVSSGQITLETDEQGGTVEVGLNYTATIKPLPVNTNGGSGQNYMRERKIIRINLMVNETFGVKVGGVEVPVRAFGESVLDTEPVPKTGIIEDVLDLSGFERTAQPVITVPDATPFHLMAIEYEVQSS